MIFENKIVMMAEKVVMNTEKEYLSEIIKKDDDMTVWKN
jgi:hypothetical protein